MCLVSGILTDYIGVNTTVLLFWCMVAIGHVIFVLDRWNGVRFIYGIGYELFYHVNRKIYLWY